MENNTHRQLDRLETKIDAINDKLDDLKVEVARNKVDTDWIKRLTYAMAPVLLFCACYCGYGMIR